MFKEVEYKDFIGFLSYLKSRGQIHREEELQKGGKHKAFSNSLPKEN